jgi:hypothetical protein
MPPAPKLVNLIDQYHWVRIARGLHVGEQGESVPHTYIPSTRQHSERGCERFPSCIAP